MVGLLRKAPWVLLTVFVAWLAFGSMHGMWTGPSVLPVPEFGSGAAGALMIPVEEADAAIRLAEEQVIAVNELGRYSALLGHALALLAFLTTASITLVAGYHGHAPDGGDTQGGLPARAARIVAFLAASAAVLTAASSGLAVYAEENYERSDALREELLSLRADLANAPDEAAARDVMLRLRTKFKRP